jgi:hypothetical protein
MRSSMMPTMMRTARSLRASSCSAAPTTAGRKRGRKVVGVVEDGPFLGVRSSSTSPHREVGLKSEQQKRVLALNLGGG